MRLIDANALIDWLTKHDRFRGNCENCTDIDCLDCIVEECVKNFPAMDAVEVVHGRWIKAKDGFDIDRGWKCSSCNNYVYAMTYEPYKYCPHCGAKMDGDKNGS